MKINWETVLSVVVAGVIISLLASFVIEPAKAYVSEKFNLELN